MPDMMKPYAGTPRRFRPWLRWTGRALLATGLLLLGYVALVLVQAKLYDSAANEYVNRASASIQSRVRPPAGFTPSRPFAEGEILGHISIARLGVSAAVLQGTASRTLRLGVGHIPGTAIPGVPGNSAIAGHRDTFFRQLEKIHDGDEIEVKTAGTTTLYVVEWAKIVPPADTSVLDSTRETALTLVTCYPFYFIGPAPKRFVVRAHKLSASTPERTRAEVPVPGAGPAAPLPGGTP